MEARVQRIETGNADRNAWVIGDGEEVIVVDPGEYADTVFEAIGDREIIAVICTHGHAAHTAAAPGGRAGRVPGGAASQGPPALARGARR